MEQNRDAPIALFLGDVVRLRKPHPCGGFEWSVVRLGADIGLTCTTCGRRVLLPRREVQRRTRLFVSRGPGFEAAQELIAAQDALSETRDPVSVSIRDQSASEPEAEAEARPESEKGMNGR